MHRTYVRRRVLALALTLAIVSGLSGPVARALGGADRVDLVASRTYVIRHGDTLWSIARSIAPDRDPRETVHEISDRNGGVPGALVPGQVLSIPAVG